MVTMENFWSLVAEHSWRDVEDVAWTWAATLSDADKAHAVEMALAGRGVEGIEDLAFAGPELGGLDGAEVDALVAFVEAELGAVALAA
ncbi:hypothetical protein [Microbacterium sp. USTB-Y]|uniref:hypothetical protein n=1 Tax=Microbacterium sp. USTB-Y TaxID=2823692 RepID=UPI00203BB37D|nr:hypothetical protein [Microbacterium sp. USTB-Y]